MLRVSHWRLAGFGKGLGQQRRGTKRQCDKTLYVEVGNAWPYVTSGQKPSDYSRTFVGSKSARLKKCAMMPCSTKHIPSPQSLGGGGGVAPRLLFGAGTSILLAVLQSSSPGPTHPKHPEAHNRSY